MNFTIIDAPQRSQAWFTARLGKLSGSRASDMMATLKGSGEAAARRDLRVQLVVERLTHQIQEDVYVNADMRRGVELEPAARAAYEAHTGALVQESGFLVHPELEAGCSLDGHLGGFEGIVELKVPRAATHLKYLRGGGLPPEHKWQVVHNLFISGARYCDFVSYAPAFPSALQLFITRVTRDSLDLVAYELVVRRFLSEVEDELQSVSALMDQAAVA